MARNAGSQGERWFERGARVRYGDRVGVVQSSFTGGLHFVYFSDKRELLTIAGTELELAENGGSPPQGSGGSTNAPKR